MVTSSLKNCLRFSKRNLKEHDTECHRNRKLQPSDCMPVDEKCRDIISTRISFQERTETHSEEFKVQDIKFEVRYLLVELEYMFSIYHES